MKSVYLGVFILLLSLGIRAERPGTDSYRFLSYNIHAGIGMDKRFDLGRIAALIDRYKPDIVALQEVDSATRRSGGVDVIRQLGIDTRMYSVFAPAISFQGGEYGVGLLSKEKPLSWKQVPLPGREEARALLIVEFQHYIFCNTHFSLDQEERLRSVAVIERELSGTEKPVFLAGDLNAAPDSEPLVRLKKNFSSLVDVKKPTFPSIAPRRCIDYILGLTGSQEPEYVVLSAGVVADTVASDHRPLFAEVRLKSAPERIFATDPYLQNPVGGGITVSWVTHVPVYGWVEYGEDPQDLKKAHTLVDGQVICNDLVHQVRLESLVPGKTYYYRVCSREILSYKAYSKQFGHTAVTDVQTFRLPAASDRDFTAFIFNDIHKKHPTLDSLFEQVKEYPYDLVFFNGDCIDDPENREQAVRSLAYYNRKVGADRIPVFYLRGNHEIRNAYSIGLRELFDYVGDKTYGAFSWGDTRFVMLDCGEDKPDDTPVYYGLNDFTQLRSDQVGFLQQELSSKEFKKADKKVLIHHVPIYRKPRPDRPDRAVFNPCRELWGEILAKAPFQVAINGHTHRFTHHPAGTDNNPFPVVVGGGNSLDGATVMVLQKKGSRMTLRVLNPQGKELLLLDFSK